MVAHGLSCQAACRILPDQGSELHPLHWQADSQTLDHQGSQDPPLDARFINKELYIQGRSQIRKEKITYVISDVIIVWWGGEPLVQRRLWSVLSKGQVSGKVSRGADA